MSSPRLRCPTTRRTARSGSPTPASTGGTLRLAALLLALLVLTTGGTARGAWLEVVPEAAVEGTLGLRIGVEPGCPEIDQAVVTGTIVEEGRVVAACREVLAAGAAVASGAGLALRAGERVVLGDGFSVASGGSLRAEVDPAIEDAAYVARRIEAEPSLASRVYVRLDALSLAGGAEIVLLELVGGDGPAARVVLEPGAGTAAAALARVRSAGGGWTETAPVDLGPGWHAVELGWEEETLSAPGSATLRVDGAAAAALEGITTGAVRLEEVRLGAVTVTGDATGTLDVDAVEIRRQGPVGTL